MPKCPHCGEVYRYGQEKCYACGEPVRSRGQRSGGAIPPLVFVAAGGLVAIAVLGFVLITANRQAAAREQRAQAEQQRVRDSVRQANAAQRGVLRRSRKEDSVNAEIADLEYRLAKLAAKADRGRLPPEKAELVADIDTRIVRLKVRLAAMADRPDVDQQAIADTVRAEAREVRNLLSRLSRVR